MDKNILIITSFSVYFALDYFLKKNFIKKTKIKYKNEIIKSTRYTLFVIFCITLMSEVGVDVDALLTSFGITGLAVSLASREVLSNLISGLSIQMHRPFKIGNKIKVKGYTGNVISINIRETVLETDEGTKIIVPNRTLLSEPIEIIN